MTEGNFFGQGNKRVISFIRGLTNKLKTISSTTQTLLACLKYPQTSLHPGNINSKQM